MNTLPYPFQPTREEIEDLYQDIFKVIQALPSEEAERLVSRPKNFCQQTPPYKFILE